MTGQSLEKLKNGDKDAFEQLVKENQENVYRIVFSILHNSQDTEEVAQDVFVKIFIALKAFNGSSSLSTWIYKIAYNTALDVVRKNKKKPLHKSLSDIEDSEVFSIESDSFLPEQELEKIELRSEINRAMKTLPEEQKQAVYLRDVYGFSYDEIIAMTGLKDGTLKSRLSRGRENLKIILKKQWNK